MTFEHPDVEFFRDFGPSITNGHVVGVKMKYLLLSAEMLLAAQVEETRGKNKNRPQGKAGCRSVSQFGAVIHFCKLILDIRW